MLFRSVMPSGRPRKVVWDLTGTDPDVPQLTVANCPNDAARSFVTLLDNVFVEMTRLDSRFQPQMINKYESTLMRGLLTTLYTITQRKGGEFNRSDIPVGTLPTQEPATFGGTGA